MQVLKQLTVNSILNGVHHLSLCHDCPPLLLNTSSQELSFKCNLSQYVQNLLQIQHRRYVNMELLDS